MVGRWPPYQVREGMFEFLLTAQMVPIVYKEASECVVR